MAGDRITAAQFRSLGSQPAPPVAGPRHGKKQWAKGRLPSGTMNKTEARYLAEVITPRMAAGELVWWQFEGIKLRVAPSTFITIDFAQMRADGTVELVDVKGAAAMVEDDAHVKMKVAADRYPFPIFYAWPMGGTTARSRGWHIESVGRD